MLSFGDMLGQRKSRIFAIVLTMGKKRVKQSTKLFFKTQIFVLIITNEIYKHFGANLDFKNFFFPCLTPSLPEVLRFFKKKFTILWQMSRACETIGLAGTAPKTNLFSSKFYALSNGNIEKS